MTNPSETRDSELVARLRKWADWLDSDIGTDQPAGKDLREAADTIDRLTSTGEAVAWLARARIGGGQMVNTLKEQLLEEANSLYGNDRFGGYDLIPLYASPREGHVEVPGQAGHWRALDEAAEALRSMYRGDNADNEPFHAMATKAVSAYLAALPHNQGETKP